ncbi:MAG: glycosyltransferase [Actinomycetota bacterium]|nr:glycosyltransferase [Actinomycetota bacterium]
MTHHEERPLVTVVTPCLNPGDRLARCIESVGAQTYPRVEHVVIDGGSTDGTSEFLERSSVRWISEPDSGQAEAINKGFELADGDVLGWLNADDVLVPDALERVVQAMHADPTAGWVMGDVVVTDGVTARRERPAVVRGPRAWATRNLAAQPGSFHPRWALEKVGYLDESFRFMMDLDLWLRLLDEGLRWVYVPRILAIFELHAASKSGAVSHAQFLEEEAWARLKSGRVDEAGFALGRAAAWWSAEQGSATKGDPWTAIEQMTALRPRLREVPKRAVAAAIAVESAILGLKRRDFLKVVALARPSSWVHPLARARLRDVFRRELRRLAGRDRAPYDTLTVR